MARTLLVAGNEACCMFQAVDFSHLKKMLLGTRTAGFNQGIDRLLLRSVRQRLPFPGAFDHVVHRFRLYKCAIEGAAYINQGRSY